MSLIKAIQDGITAQNNYTYIHVARLPLHLLSKIAGYSREQAPTIYSGCQSD
jgi:hypothetical protein